MYFSVFIEIEMQEPKVVLTAEDRAYVDKAVKLWRELFGPLKYKEAENTPKYASEPSEIPKILGGKNATKNSRVYAQNFGSKLTVNEDAKNTLVTFDYKGLKLTKHSNFDMFYFPGILKILKDYNKDIPNVKKFLNSYSFYCQLCLLDSSLPKYGNVYLLINKEKKTCKVGMSYDIKQRYSKTKIENELSYIVPVYDMKSTETKILKRFRVMFGIPVNGNETFSYTNYETAIKEFLSIAKENEVESSKMKIPQHITRRRFVSKMSDIWISFLATKVLFSYYIEEPESRNNAMEFLKLIELDLKEDSYAFNQHNDALDTDVRYILFHKYTLIFNVKDEYVSGSHLYNSICRADGKKKKYTTFKRFIDSDF